MPLAAEGVTVRYGPKLVLDSVDFRVREGEVVGLLGPNGAGKTTLLRVLASLLTPAAGAVRFDGRPVASWPRRELARRVAYLAQGAVCHWPLTVERLVALGRLPHLEPWRGAGERDRAAVLSAMRDADVLAFARRTVTTLSGGERMRALIARALAVAPTVLLADEPTASLDPAHQLRVMTVLRRLAERGGAVVVVLHDLTLAARFCDEVVLLAGGRVLAKGPPEAAFTPANLATAFRVRAEFGRREGALYVLPWEEFSSPPTETAASPSSGAPPGDAPC